MRRLVLSLGLVAATFVPAAQAQVFQFQTPPPQITAASADWQLNGEPVVWMGVPYYPTAERYFFDGNVMMQVGSYQGVPLYADATQEPNSMLLVPISQGLMRRYERLRTGNLAGTAPSRTTRYPIPNVGSP